MQLFLAQIKWSWGIQFELKKSYYFGFHSPVYESYSLRAMKGEVQLQKGDFFEFKTWSRKQKGFLVFGNKSVKNRVICACVRKD